MDVRLKRKNHFNKYRVCIAGNKGVNPSRASASASLGKDHSLVLASFLTRVHQHVAVERALRAQVFPADGTRVAESVDAVCALFRRRRRCRAVGGCYGCRTIREDCLIVTRVYQRNIQTNRPNNSDLELRARD